ncbi:MAG: GAF domain-containing protein [Caldilineaceae bacterium]|nr:GAF domain-containing protein [Caldilineaceae bacterium]
MSKAAASDTQRDAEKYRQLVRALRHATTAVRTMEDQGQADILEVLTKLLPNIAAALGAQKAFIIRPTQSFINGQPAVEYLRIDSATGLHSERQPASHLIQSILSDGRPRVIDSLDDEEPRPILGLELIQATSAILVRLQILDQTYIVGVCNKRDREAGPFLAGDRMTLDNILELIAIGARTSERRRRELDSIEHISRIAAQASPDAVAQAIVQQAVRLTHGNYAELWAVNKQRAQLDFVTAFHEQQPNWTPSQKVLLLNDETLGGYVARHQRSHYAASIDPDHRYSHGNERVQSAFGVPLRFNEQILGVLFVASELSQGINRDERRFIEELAPHAAIALHNARLQNIRQSVIGFIQEVTDVIPLRDQLQQLGKHLPTYVNAVNLFLAVYDTEQDEITFPLAFERGELVPETKKLPGQLYGPKQPGRRSPGFTEWVLQYRTTLLVENFATWPERYAIDPKVRVDVKSCLVVPLLRKDRIVGALGLRSFYADKGSFDEYDQYFLEGIANHVAIVLDNSRRYDTALHDLRRANEELQARVRELKAVSAFQQRISDVEEEEREIQNINREARQAMAGVGLDTANMYIALYDQPNNQIRFPLAYEGGVEISESEKAHHALYGETLFGEHRSVAEWVMKAWKFSGARGALLINHDFKEWKKQRGIRTFSIPTKAWLGAPMVFRDRLIGMIGLRHTSEEGFFKESHKELLEIIASQAAIALTNARLFDELRGKIKELEALTTAASAISRAGLERDVVLQTILEQAINATGAFFGTLHLADGEYLDFTAAWPRQERDQLRERFGRMALNGPGVTVRAFRLNDAQLVSDVSKDRDFLDSTGATGSALAVVLRRHGEHGRQPIGVLNVEHGEVGRLTAAHRKTLISLSNLAVVAIENAEKADQLSRSNAIAIMGAWGADIVHELHREVAVVRLVLESLRLEDPLPRVLLLERLQEIDQAVSNLVMPVLPGQLPEPGRALAPQDICAPDPITRSEVEQLHRIHQQVRFQLELNCTTLRIQMHELWLRRLLRHLIKNAVRANQQLAHELVLAVGTRRNDGMVEIWVRDNGSGIPPEIAAILFNRPIPYSKEQWGERFGRGLLLVRHIVEQHGGSVRLTENLPGKSVCFTLSIPEAVWSAPISP